MKDGNVKRGSFYALKIQQPRTPYDLASAVYIRISQPCDRLRGNDRRLFSHVIADRTLKGAVSATCIENYSLSCLRKHSSKNLLPIFTLRKSDAFKSLTSVL